MVFMVDTMVDMDTMDMVSMVDMEVMDMAFGDVRRGKLKPNLLPNLPLKLLPNLVTTMDVDILDATDMALDTMDADTIGENKSQIQKTHYQHSASKCLDGNNDDLSFCCRTQSL